MNVFLRYLTELAIIILDAVYIFMPVIDALRMNRLITYGLAGIILPLFVLAASWISSQYLLPVIPVLVVCVAFLFAVFFFSVNISLGRKLFCFFTSIMLGAFSLLYSIALMASFEAENTLWESTKLLTLEGGFTALGLSVLVGVVFFRLLTYQLPMLLKDERAAGMWNFMFMLPLGATLLVAWLTPVWPKYLLIGRSRLIMMVLLPLIPLLILLTYYLLWRIASKFSESARLQQENTLLMMEGKRYHELRTYMDATRAMRHDFRKHILVITRLAESEKYSELRSYLKQWSDVSDPGCTGYCANVAVDAAASYYTSQAQAHNIVIDWRLSLPAVLPMNEAEYCAMLGNLTENALRAVRNLPEDMRRINVVSSMPSESIIGLSASNPFSGKITTGKDGLPVSQAEGHGIGLASVMNTVKRYNGTMEIRTEGGIFTADIILYCG
ncbi:MAG: GHKL domain-containing protein [Synergistaceae bacterium]|nr:GHKL domain-containing protein [Synergistaceae bacterium]